MKPSNRMLAPTKLTMHEESPLISQPKPKIRIIHIVAPEIITTDPENFRELVQKLTGKPAEREKKTEKRNNMEPPFVQTAKRVKRESKEMYGMENPNAFLSFLEDVDVDGFMPEMSEFPLLPFMPSQINTFGEMPLC